MNSPQNFIDNLILLDGIITYNDFTIKEAVSFQEQENSFKEDILQMEFGPRYTLDVGWYPEGDPNGYFWIRGIQDCNWQQPVISIQCHSLHELKTGIETVTAVLYLKKRDEII